MAANDEAVASSHGRTRHPRHVRLIRISKHRTQAAENRASSVSSMRNTNIVIAVDEEAQFLPPVRRTWKFELVAQGRDR